MRWLVLVSYVFSTLANARIYSRADINLWQQESRLVVKAFQVKYQKAATDFRRLGPAAFASHFEMMGKEENKWLIRELNKVEELPDLKLTENSLQVFDNNKLVAELLLTDISQGIFKFPQKTYRYDFRLNMMENHKNWTEKKSAFSLFLDQLFIPQAEATMSKGALATVLGLVGLIVGLLLSKKSATTMAAISEDGASATNGHVAGGTSGGGNVTTGGETGGTTGSDVTGGVPPPDNVSDTGVTPSASKATIGVTDFPGPDEDLLKDCPDFVNPEKMSAADLSSQNPFTQEMYKLMQTFQKGGSYNAGVSTSSINPNVVAKIARGESTSIGENMCSQTTQILYLAYLAKRNPNAKLDHLYPNGNPDGVGPWGYWNANGPGTASYFHQAGVGTNTARPANAPLGSFLKILWKHNDGPALGPISSDEGGEGHSVAFLGCQKDSVGNATAICTWGSHMKSSGPPPYPGGVGVKCYPKEKLGLLIFSTPSGAVPGPESLKQDPFLVDLQKSTVRGRDNVMNKLQAI